MSEVNLPYFSLVIVNYNGLRWLNTCLSSVYNQTFSDFEVIFVDNKSSDESVAFVKSNYPLVSVIENDHNDGFAGGNNLGFLSSKGEYILLVNNDMELPSDFLQKMFLITKEHGEMVVFQPQIRLMDRREYLDNCGSFWTSSSLLYHLGYGKHYDNDKYNSVLKVFAVKGACMCINRSIIEKIGLFDEDAWCYYEETDFCHRALLSGYDVKYIPNAIIYHAMGGTSSFFDSGYVQFHNIKNKLSSFYKNFSYVEFFLTFLKFTLLTNILCTLWIIKGQYKNVMAAFKAYLWFFSNLQKLNNKRRLIQSFRKVSDAQILKDRTRNPRISYYFYLFKDLTQYVD
jgi:GT2 family glycosyltransferase